MTCLWPSPSPSLAHFLPLRVSYTHTHTHTPQYEEIESVFICVGECVCVQSVPNFLFGDVGMQTLLETSFSFSPSFLETFERLF